MHEIWHRNTLEKDVEQAIISWKSAWWQSYLI